MPTDTLLQEDGTVLLQESDSGSFTDTFLLEYGLYAWNNNEAPQSKSTGVISLTEPQRLV